MSLDWYKWFPSRWAGSRKVQRMSLAARGLYREMLDEAWIKVSLPDDPVAIADMLGLEEDEVQSLWREVRSSWIAEGDGIVSPMLEEIRAQVDAYRNRQSIAGRASAAARAARTQQPTVQPPSTMVQPRLDSGDHGSAGDSHGQPIEEKENQKENQKETSARAKADRMVALAGLAHRQYPRTQVCDGREKPVPKSAPSTVTERFIKTCGRLRVSPDVLYCAIGMYVSEAKRGGNYLPALQVLLGREKPYHENFIEKATEYIAKNGEINLAAINGKEHEE